MLSSFWKPAKCPITILKMILLVNGTNYTFQVASLGWESVSPEPWGSLGLPLSPPSSARRPWEVIIDVYFSSFLCWLFRATWPCIQHSPCRSTDLHMVSWLSWIRSLGLSWLSAEGAEVRMFLWSLSYLRCSWGRPCFFVGSWIKHLEFLWSVEVALMWLSFCNSHHDSLSS